jgi:hypothetical protein
MTLKWLSEPPKFLSWLSAPSWKLPTDSATSKDLLDSSQPSSLFQGIKIQLKLWQLVCLRQSLQLIHPKTPEVSSRKLIDEIPQKSFLISIFYECLEFMASCN